MDHKNHAWHREVLPEAAVRRMEDLQRDRLLEPFYLAGGTGLALGIGHRRSRDLDFFSAAPFEVDHLIHRLQRQPDFALIAKGEQTVHVHLGQTKVSFLGYPYPLLFPGMKFLEATIADARDIACMKISVIAGGGTRRDFVDLYVVAKELGLGKILEVFKNKFASANYNTVHVLKSLTYFEDAEKEPTLEMLVPLSWEEVKESFWREAPLLTLR